MSVIEVLVALGMASILVFSAGNLVSATHRLNTASAKQDQALLVAQQQYEQLVSFANDPTTAASVFSVTHNGSVLYRLDTSIIPWTLQDVTANPGTAWVTLTTVGGDADVQQLSSYATWQSGAIVHQEVVSSLLTDWKNLVP